MSFTILPSFSKLRGLVLVREERHLWINGVLWQDHSTVIELSFEQHLYGSLPNTHISYMGVWTGRSTRFEFQLGLVVKKPTEDDWQGMILPVIKRLEGYRPLRVDV